MTYLHQRKILSYLRENFKFLPGRYYFFDMAKIDIDKGIFEYKDFTSENAFDVKTNLAQEQNLFHIIAYSNIDNQIVLGVNGNDFFYYENLTSGEIEYDDCAWGDVDPLHIKLETLQLIRELNGGRST